ncbi:NADH dehydrogenase (ubiquinone) complex I, assembly factor 6 [Frankliniella fusca]|uniref:NADH dehydrogenase (Ubiquinone) complex I, assembly factor 6 n=1 Tax=Frankliniella fusca TaxID=407009 RepID=A0AAE1HDI9_9NEOP|nr:NADH dehydrogenase (ubiquinone) complex I, assembly factor 6 [Frankliniella fusca]
MKVFMILRTTPRHLVRYKSTQSRNPKTYCIDLVRKHDFENYLCSVFLRRGDQDCAFAIRAFNIEVANVEEQVSQTTIGLMRLKFWEDAIDKIFQDNPPQHPVAQEIHRVLGKNAMSKHNLRQLVLARTEKLSFNTFQSLDHMEKYADQTCSSLFHLQLASCGSKNVNADHAFSHLGKAQGLTNLIRSVPYYAKRKIVIIPQDILLQHRVSHENIIRGGCDKPIRDAVFDVACRANSHVDKALSLIDQIPNRLFRHLLPVIPLKSYLEKLRLADFDVFHPNLQLRDTALPIKLLWKTLRGRL